MKTRYLLPTAIACLAASSLTFAVTAEEHASHHPDQAASATAAASTPTGKAAKKVKTAAPTKSTAAADASTSMAMDKQMQAMREMHEKMMNAKTPEERRALMGDQMKVMKDGMAMMNQMGSGMGMGGSAPMSSAPAASGPKMGMGGMGGMADMHEHHEMMMKRMDMMQMMMQTMMDRLSAESDK